MSSINKSKQVHTLFRVLFSKQKQGMYLLVTNDNKGTEDHLLVLKEARAQKIGLKFKVLIFKYDLGKSLSKEM